MKKGDKGHFVVLGVEDGVVHEIGVFVEWGKAVEYARGLAKEMGIEKGSAETWRAADGVFISGDGMIEVQVHDAQEWAV